MARLVSIFGVVAHASDDAARGMLDSGFFTLAEGEVMPQAEPEPEEVEAPDATEDGGDFALGAFGDGDGEDLSSLTNAQLREIAVERGINVPARANKATIIGLLEEG